jgi:hypothetical protein
MSLLNFICEGFGRAADLQPPPLPPKDAPLLLATQQLCYNKDIPTTAVWRRLLSEPPQPKSKNFYYSFNYVTENYRKLIFR